MNISIVRGPGELTTVFVTNLRAFSHYAVTVTAFTGSLENVGSDGKANGPLFFQTLEDGRFKLCPLTLLTLVLCFCIILSFFTEPKDPPKNVTVSGVPEEVNKVRVSFSPPEEPNGNITAYYILVYEKDQLVKNISLDNILRESQMLVAFIDGLKGGHTYSIQELPKLLPDLATTDADLPWNKSKNRFLNIKPCMWLD
ncbi:hypothetical protein XENOCAPTIV_004489 [Xenoophorus captivus]|uniref:Fibronectin type-III domain-containing protein n=1 Tax=Xenoophorus captivus TaxID=1517983 RepID=A0ABV0RBR2_9TELE